MHKTFASLTQEEQKYANIFLNDILRGDVMPEEGKTFRDYVTEYMARAQDDQIHRFASRFGLDEGLLRTMMSVKVTDANINEYGRFEKLKKSADSQKTAEYFSAVAGKKVPPTRVSILLDRLLRDFLKRGLFEDLMQDDHKPSRQFRSEYYPEIEERVLEAAEPGDGELLV